MYNLGTEYWLLSDAPEDSNAAVSVALSQDRARIGSCQHVIFISDACRSTVAGQQFASIMGGNIFPSPSHPARPEQSVDLFFACGFDSTSIEVRTADGSEGYRSIYTDKSDVANFTPNHHSIPGYLQDQTDARWIYNALL
jgi:hypothetical protein